MGFGGGLRADCFNRRPWHGAETQSRPSRHPTGTINFRIALIFIHLKAAKELYCV